MAVTTLPAPMAAFYKQHLPLIERWAVLPDQRRYAIPEEACRHYLDFEAYDSIPLRYEEARAMYSEDTLQRHGALPWNIQLVYYRLRAAFERKDHKAIIKYSSELGHYLADAHVPLHTTANYNGQLTGQHGIHGLWESRLPELFNANYNFYTGPAVYISSVPWFAWNLVHQTHVHVEAVLREELKVRKQLPESRWYEYEQRGNQMIRQYSRVYARMYHRLLAGMVEHQMRKSIHTVGSFWYTAWMEAGQPDLSKDSPPSIEEEEEDKKHGAVHSQECNH